MTEEVEERDIYFTCAESSGTETAELGITFEIESRNTQTLEQHINYSISSVKCNS